MFFVISKLYSFLLSPFIWLFILLLLMLVTGNPKRLRKIIIITFCGFIFFSNSFILNEIMNIWEYKTTKKQELSRSYDVGVVLGGGMVTIERDITGKYSEITPTGSYKQLISIKKGE